MRRLRPSPVGPVRPAPSALVALHAVSRGSFCSGYGAIFGAGAILQAGVVAVIRVWLRGAFINGFPRIGRYGLRRLG